MKTSVGLSLDRKHDTLPPVRFDELVEFGKLSFPYINESIDTLLKMKREGLEKEMGAENA